MELPRKDKHGNGYLSYSQISLFKRSKEDYYDQYILNKPFTGNEYNDFGSKVGDALESGILDGFNKYEALILKQVTRLDEFERRVILNCPGFYVIGYIDTNKYDFSRIIDYKTGGNGKEEQYYNHNYTQLHLYALSLRQETGVTPVSGSVEFIRRIGDPYKREPLSVGNESPIKINVDLSLGRLTSVYFDTIRVAKEIEQFYSKHKP